MLINLYHSQGCGTLKTLNFVSGMPLGVLYDVWVLCLWLYGRCTHFCDACQASVCHFFGFHALFSKAAAMYCIRAKITEWSQALTSSYTTVVLVHFGTFESMLVWEGRFLSLALIIALFLGVLLSYFLLHLAFLFLLLSFYICRSLALPLTLIIVLLFDFC